ncbi:hypothetical protein WG906_18395 [Pedobacter sp. P351]|uniref:hypothetical protein n=1 Tax=Pedobacter superstes TaxID=3133441 RepID=UPI0030A987AB
MIGLELKIKFIEDKAYLTRFKAMSFTQLGLPEIAKCFKSPAYWILRVINYKASEQKLFCEITSYHVGETEFSFSQTQLYESLSKVEIVRFRSIDTFNLLKTLAGTPGTFTTPAYVPVYRTQSPYLKEPSIQSVTETFFVPIKNVHFKLGFVSISKKFKEFKEALEITIPNLEIIEEFDAVKNYFGNVLGSKKIEVNLEVEITDGSITSNKASSPEIAKIDKALIEKVRLEFVRSTMVQKLPLEVEQSLFTMEGFFDAFADEKYKPDTFHQSETELLEDLLTISNTKHYKHLRFLSSKHAHDVMKLRFIQKPFSFIFLLEGKMNYHIVWETLDTEEATYVWHIVKDINLLKHTLKRIDHIINDIKVKGKLAYISSTEDSLKRLYHDYSDSDDGFLKWKSELENVAK